ncbi:MAG: signal peptide peptidase SppA [Acidobacteria bacterium]|nr:signal peptide peptidase SppA [Acidobacteriota bacterium]
MALRRGVTFVISMIVAATMISMAVLLVMYVLVSREPAVPSNAALVLPISGELEESREDVIGLVRGRRPRTVRSIVDNLRKAKVDDRIKGVLIAPSGLQAPFWGKLQELRDAILDFRKSGKPAVAYLEDGLEREYFLATACDRIFLMPTTPLELNGLATFDLFLRGTLDKIETYPDMLAIGEYKTAVNLFTEKGYTSAHREQSASLNRDLYDQLVGGIAEGRRKSVPEVRALLDQGPFLPEEALRVGLIDDLAYEDQIDDKVEIGGRDWRRVTSDEYEGVKPSSVGLNRGPRIAVIYAVGLINTGRSGWSPTDGPVVGSETLIEYVRKARGDSSIRAIVLRVDSPGGSAVASDAIWRELLITRQGRSAKPVVVSMSDLAASGGYYIAMAGSDIVAQPATLTGSIGIYSGKMVTGGTFEKLGAAIDGVKDGKFADMHSPIRRYSPEERAKILEQMQAYYDQWIEKIAASRGLTPERVDSLAQGRVWTGQQARQIGLVDELGGLDRAVALAKQRAKIDAREEVEIIVYPPRRTFYELLVQQLSSVERVGLGAWIGLQDRRAIGALTAPVRIFRRGELLALMPLGFLR